MKRQFVLLLIISGFTLTSQAQTWTGTTTTGKVGIGTSTPDARLTIVSDLTTSGGTTIGLPFKIENTTSNGGAEANLVEVHDRPNLGLPVPYKLLYWVSNKGNVGIRNSLRIGLTAANGAYANYKLSVDGDMIAKRCVIQVDNWADYVFADNYELPTLNEVASFVAENKHLPGVPSEAEIKEKGLDMGEMNKILMQKVEELTLYMIEQDKKIKVLEDKLNR